MTQKLSADFSRQIFSKLQGECCSQDRRRVILFRSVALPLRHRPDETEANVAGEIVGQVSLNFGDTVATSENPCWAAILQPRCSDSQRDSFGDWNLQTRCDGAVVRLLKLRDSVDDPQVLHPKPLVVERKVQALIIAPSQPEHAHQCQRVVQLFKVGVAAAGELCEQVKFSGDLPRAAQTQILLPQTSHQLRTFVGVHHQIR